MQQQQNEPKQQQKASRVSAIKVKETKHTCFFLKIVKKLVLWWYQIDTKLSAPYCDNSMTILESYYRWKQMYWLYLMIPTHYKYCLVLFEFFWYFWILFGTVWNCLELFGIYWYCFVILGTVKVLSGIASYHLIMPGIGSTDEKKTISQIFLFKNFFYLVWCSAN